MAVDFGKNPTHDSSIAVCEVTAQAADGGQVCRRTEDLDIRKTPVVEQRERPMRRGVLWAATRACRMTAAAHPLLQLGDSLHAVAAPLAHCALAHLQLRQDSRSLLALKRGDLSGAATRGGAAMAPTATTTTKTATAADAASCTAATRAAAAAAPVTGPTTARTAAPWPCSCPGLRRPREIDRETPLSNTPLPGRCSLRLLPLPQDARREATAPPAGEEDTGALMGRRRHLRAMSGVGRRVLPVCTPPVGRRRMRLLLRPEDARRNAPACPAGERAVGAGHLTASEKTHPVARRTAAGKLTPRRAVDPVRLRNASPRAAAAVIRLRRQQSPRRPCLRRVSGGSASRRCGGHRGGGRRQ